MYFEGAIMTKAKLDEIRAMMNDPKVISGEGLSNEENIRIYGYDPEDEQIVRHFVKKLQETTLSCDLKVFNLYEIFLQICEKKKIMKAIPRMEEKKGPQKLLAEIQKFATVDAFIREMQYEPHGDKDVLLITGIGSVFPFVRIHQLLDGIGVVIVVTAINLDTRMVGLLHGPESESREVRRHRRYRECDRLKRRVAPRLIE